LRPVSAARRVTAKKIPAEPKSISAAARKLDVVVLPLATVELDQPHRDFNCWADCAAVGWRRETARPVGVTIQKITILIQWEKLVMRRVVQQCAAWSNAFNSWSVWMP